MRAKGLVGRLDRLEEKRQTGERPVFLHIIGEPESAEEVEQNRQAEERRLAALAAGRAVVTFRHIAIPTGKKTELHPE